ncbi:MAG TPA: M14 family zinc carboxypeptidase [Thermoguttaceae bacterium]|nr:M14 family zinc carboxypeptidase [Thermoguttaceae bacterium]
MQRVPTIPVLLLLASSFNVLSAAEPDTAGDAAQKSPLEFIHTGFENGSPLYWEIDEEGAVQVYFVYDQERASPNRANGHWHFQLQAKQEADLTVVLNNFDNVWNGKLGSPIDDETICFTSPDGIRWHVVRGERTEANQFKARLHMDGPTLYVARLEPYRIADLERLEEKIGSHPLVEISPIGRTVEGRELEIIRIGKPDAPHRVLLRGRAHPWESGGSWVVQGLIERLLRDDADARRYLARYCVYVMPMANKDGVARGRTRFNSQGKDLNRNWDRPADGQLAPENAALERWLAGVIRQGRGPELAIDLHNDAGGKLHVSRPNVELDAYLGKMQLLEKLLREHTWFTEGSTGSDFRNPGTLGEGLLERYGVDACILELNANRIAGLDDYPSAKNWQLFGQELCEVFFEYFGSR